MIVYGLETCPVCTKARKALAAAAKPKVMARPVIRDGDAFYLGWDEAVQEALCSG